MHDILLEIVNKPLILMLALLAGVTLGTIFFFGLWWTVQQSVSSRRPALWLLISLLLRMSVALTGFYFVAGGQWERLLACLLGFFIARMVVTWLTGAHGRIGANLTSESSHAS